MMQNRNLIFSRCAVIIITLEILTACVPSTIVTEPTVVARPTATIALPQGTPTNIWFALQERTPYPYHTPLPPANSTSIDGTYVKVEPEGETVHCRRCPDYADDGGVWLLRFTKGIFLIHSQLTEWRSLGSYTVSGDHLWLFNDPTCTEDVGEYTWKIVDRKLILVEIKDDCAIHLRARDLTQEPWSSCQPPNIEAAITDHWNKPQGCP